MMQKKGARKGRTQRLTKAQMAAREKAIIADIRGGVLSYRQIAAKHKVSLPTVNNKARKAGISRGRRKGARIVVAAPVRKVRRVSRKAGRVVARKTRKKAARKAGGRAPRARTMVPVVAKKTAKRRTARRRVRRTIAPRMTRRRGDFAAAFRELVLKHYPAISLAKFDRLTRTVQSAVA